MPSLRMRGTFDLTEEAIDKAVEDLSPGVIAFGHMDERRGMFIVQRVARSDGDVKGELKRWIGNYDQFKYELSFSGMDAFERECEIYHDFGEVSVLDNATHPMPPMGRSWKCPRC